MTEQSRLRIRPGTVTRQMHGGRFLSVLVASSQLLGAQCFSPTTTCFRSHKASSNTNVWRKPTFLSIIAPPGSGYQNADDETTTFPATYEPMMEYPGTMRPGRTPENMPFQDLPIADGDPDPVPWPHFQQIEWHHRWDPPHEHPIPMEDFIEMNGKWASPEMEAAMRAGVRRGVRERRQEEETDKRSTIITDDDDDELGGGIAEDPIALGDGVFGQLGSDADRAATAAAVDPANQGKKDEEDEDDGDYDLDDFLLDLGLDAELEDDEDDDAKTKPQTKGGGKTGKKKDASFDLDFEDMDEDEDEDDDDDVGRGKGVSLTATSGDKTTTIDVLDDDDDIVIDDDDELEGDTVPLDEFDDDSDALDTEDIFDEGGFDFDDDFGDMDGGDMW